MIELILVIAGFLLAVYVIREALTLFGWMLVGLINMTAATIRKIKHTPGEQK